MNFKKSLLVLALCGATFSVSRIARAEDAPLTLDVTNHVRQLVQGNSLDMEANNDVGGDPAPQTIKKLKVEYTLDGKPDAKVVMEYSKLMIHPPKGVKLGVVKAVWGDLPNEKQVDVTGVLMEAIQANKLSLVVINETMHADPAPGTGKRLDVNYTVGGKAGKISVGEAETLTLPQPKDGTGSLLIVSATYHAS